MSFCALFFWRISGLKGNEQKKLLLSFSPLFLAIIIPPPLTTRVYELDRKMHCDCVWLLTDPNKANYSLLFYSVFKMKETGQQEVQKSSRFTQHCQENQCLVISFTRIKVTSAFFLDSLHPIPFSSLSRFFLKCCTQFSPCLHLDASSTLYLSSTVLYPRNFSSSNNLPNKPSSVEKLPMSGLQRTLFTSPFITHWPLFIPVTPLGPVLFLFSTRTSA